MASASINYLNFKNLLLLCSEMFVLGLFKQWLSINIFMFLLVAQLILAAECTAVLDVVLSIANQLINYDGLLCAGMAI